MPGTLDGVVSLAGTQAQQLVPKKSNLASLLDDTSDTAYSFVLENLYGQLTPSQLGEYLHALVMRDKYSEILTLFLRRPDINANYLDTFGNTALHLTILHPSLDLMLIDFLCEKGGILGKTKGAKKISPLQCCFSLNADATTVLKHLLEKWDSQLSTEDLQDLFAESMRRNWDDFSFYLVERYAGRLNMQQVLNTHTGNKPIHQAMLSGRLDVCLILNLIRDGATLQDTNAAGKTPLDLLLDAKAYDKVICVMRNFSESVTTAQLAKVFAHLISEQRYDVYAELLVMHANNRPDKEKDFLVGALSDAARHLNINTIVSVVNSLGKQQDLSLLKYIALAAGADLKTKKLAVDGIVRAMMLRENSALDVIMFTQKLEAETESHKYPNLGFYRERESASLYGHTWHGKAASGTWVRLMEDAQRKVVEQTRSPLRGVKDPVIEAFLGERTRERHFSMFTCHPEKRFLERYLKSCAPAVPEAVAKVPLLFQ
jgi:ankyrin repeat protein